MTLFAVFAEEEGDRRCREGSREPAVDEGGKQAGIKEDHQLLCCSSGPYGTC